MKRTHHTPFAKLSAIILFLASTFTLSGCLNENP